MAQPVDPQASLRAELIGQLATGQLAVEAALAELSDAGAAAGHIAELRSQLAGLVDMRRAIAQAGGSELAGLRAGVASAVAATASLADRARQNVASHQATDASLTPQLRARTTLEAVGRDLFDNKLLDPYLHFASVADEEAYRMREHENHEAYNRAIALHTAEGDRLALEIQRRQLADAKAHGAASSPKFAAMLEDLQQAQADLEAASSATKPAAAKSGRTASKSDSASPDSRLGEIKAALKAAGVDANDEPLPSDGHGLGDTAVSRGPSPKIGRA